MDEFQKVIESIIESTGIPRNTQSWSDYESLKLKFLENGWFGNSQEYDLMIAAITEWVGL